MTQTSTNKKNDLDSNNVSILITITSTQFITLKHTTIELNKHKS